MGRTFLQRQEHKIQGLFQIVIHQLYPQPLCTHAWTQWGSGTSGKWGVPVLLGSFGGDNARLKLSLCKVLFHSSTTASQFRERNSEEENVEDRGEKENVLYIFIFICIYVMQKIIEKTQYFCTSIYININIPNWKRFIFMCMPGMSSGTLKDQKRQSEQL